MNQIVPEKINMDIKTKEEIEDEENELQVQRSLEKDMYIRSDEYTEEELDRAEARGESAWDAHKEECPEVEHEEGKC